MLLAVFQDLIKPQWRKLLELLKRGGPASVADLAREVGASYMAVKQQCEELRKLGYVVRTRVPRTEVGRPEIFYGLGPKADALFPQAGVDFTLAILDELRAMHGESMPDKMLFQYFERQREELRKPLEKSRSLVEKATRLAALRLKQGCYGECRYDVESGFRLEEYHNPLQPIFDRYPRAVAMEHRMMEQLLGTRITRREIRSGKSGPVRVLFEIPTLGTP